MDFNRLTIKSQEAIAAAQELARRTGNPELYPEHLTLALLEQELPRQLVPDAGALRAEAEAKLGKKFDLKAFHAVVLGAGAVTLPVLADRVHAWIAQ